MGQFQEHLLSITKNGTDVEVLTIQALEKLSLTYEQAEKERLKQVYGPTSSEQDETNPRQSYDPAESFMRGHEYM